MKMVMNLLRYIGIIIYYLPLEHISNNYSPYHLNIKLQIGISYSITLICLNGKSLCLSFMQSYPLREIHQERNYIYNFWSRDGESIAQPWGRLKSLMLKCPNHELPKEIIL